MVVAAENPYRELSWTGVETEFAAGFSAAETSDVVVRYRDGDDVVTTLTETTHYTVTLAAGGAVTVNPVSLPAAPGTVIMERVTPDTQPVPYGDLSDFSMDALETALDRQVRAGQEFRRKSDLMDASVADAEAAAAAAGLAEDGAEAAKAAALAAQSAAETAQGGAETAETGAGAARVAAETAQGLAEDARDAAIAASENLAWGYTFDSGTADADPGTAKFRFNHTNFASATYLYINETADEGDLSAVMDIWDDSSSSIKAIVRIRNPLAPANWFEVEVTGTIVDAGSYRKLPINPVGKNGTITNGTGTLLQVLRSGDAGTGAVDSFNGRSGPVVPATSDYDASQIDNDSGVPGTYVSDALDTLDGEIDTKADITYVDDEIAGITTTPAGVIAWFGGNTPPSGWLECDGSVISRTTYADLFAAIGTTFGVGDGSTTFGIPDFRGEFLRGYDNGRGVDSGRSFGSSQADDFESHTHTVNNGTNVIRNAGATTPVPSGSSYGFGGHTVTVNSAGGSETRPRNIAVLPIIKY